MCACMGRSRSLVAFAAVAVSMTGCVRLSSPGPPDAAAADRALATAQQLVEARSIGFRSLIAVDDVGNSWRVEREADHRTGATATTVDRVVRACADGPDPMVDVESPSFVLTRSSADDLVETQDSARSLASVYRDPETAKSAFESFQGDAYADCVESGLKRAESEIKLVDMAAGPIEGVKDDKATAGVRFAALYDVDGQPVGAYLDLVVLFRERVVTVLELLAVSRPFDADMRSHLVSAVRDRMASRPG